MESDGGRPDDQTIEPAEDTTHANSAAPDTKPDEPDKSVEYAAPGIPSLQTHFSTDSGVVADDQADPSLPYVGADGQQDQQQQPSIQAQFATEQDLVPDVRRIPKRHRRRRRLSVPHKYVFDRKSTATPLSGATRA